MNETLRKEVDDACKMLLKQKPRMHLGPSTASKSCYRAMWYAFRDISIPSDTPGRMMRLWDRGHLEEHRVVKWLRAAGLEVRDYRQELWWSPLGDVYMLVDWDEKQAPPAPFEPVWDQPQHIMRSTARGEGPKQWGFNNGHYAGSSDGIIGGLEKYNAFATGFGLLEFKTHNTKSYVNLSAKGLQKSKPEHHRQMQMYMLELDLKWGLYVAVNKNDDDLYFEFVEYNEATALRLKDNASKVIAAQAPPKRLSQDPSWFECSWCDYNHVCHRGQIHEKKGCRGCSFASAEDAGAWKCNLHGAEIPRDFISVGCDKWTGIG